MLTGSPLLVTVWMSEYIYIIAIGAIFRLKRNFDHFIVLQIMKEVVVIISIIIALQLWLEKRR